MGEKYQGDVEDLSKSKKEKEELVETTSSKDKTIELEANAKMKEQTSKAIQ